MKKGLRWKVGLTIAVIAVALFVSLPLKKKIHLGLDLKGGIHLVMQVVTDDAVNIETSQELLRLQEAMKKKDFTSASITNPRIVARILTPLDAEIQPCLSQ